MAILRSGTRRTGLFAIEGIVWCWKVRKGEKREERGVDQWIDKFDAEKEQAEYKRR